jgi:hypothetical protein
MIDRAVGRCKELWNTDLMDDGEGYLELWDEGVGFVTDKGAFWTLRYPDVATFHIRKGFLGVFGMPRLVIAGSEGERYHIRLGSFAAKNAQHILLAKGVQELKQ